MNLTDIDDKTIKGSQKQGIPLNKFTEFYVEAFFEDIKKLNIQAADKYPKATEHIPEMVALIKTLMTKGVAYKGEDDSIYFSVNKFSEYGKLSKIKVGELKTGARVSQDEYAKEEARDFALWKAWTPEDGEVFWETELGKGRPGWHIECSAMSTKYLGATFDIHCGGIDNMFPHHENEIAQSEAAYDEPFVRHWIHVEHLLVNGTKMSKSQGNFYTLRDLLEMGNSPRSIRHLLLTAHYRKQLNFTLEGIKQSDQALARIDNLLLRLEHIKGGKDNPELDTILEKMNRNFIESVDNDLNISGGLGVFFEFVHLINTLISEEKISGEDAAKIIKAIENIDQVFGFIFMEEPSSNVDEERINSLIEERLNAKKEKNFQRADEIRLMLENKGIILEDTKDGTRWKEKR